MKKTHKLTKEQKQQAIIDYNNGQSCDKIAIKLDITRAAVWGMLKRHGVKFRSMSKAKRIYSLNESFFEKIDTEEKAYVLGFLYGDGSVNSLNSNICMGGLQSDRQIFEDIAKIIDSSRPFTITKRNHLVFCFSSIKMREDLKALGVVPNKTKIIKFPHKYLSAHLYRHFIRGLFDSDGCITSFKNNIKYPNSFSLRWNIYSTKEMLLVIKEILEKSGILVNKLSRDKRCYENSAILYSGNINVLREIYSYLYKDSKIFLKRKRNRFDELLLSKVSQYEEFL